MSLIFLKWSIAVTSIIQYVSGNISSLSGSDSESDVDTDSDHPARPGNSKKLPGSRRRLIHSENSSTDSESESGNQVKYLTVLIYFSGQIKNMLILPVQ